MEVVNIKTGVRLRKGDRVTFNTPTFHLKGKPQTIKGFHLGRTGSLCIDTDLSNKNGLSVQRGVAKLEPLFTTADGVAIYTGDKYYVCVTANMNANSRYTGIEQYPQTVGIDPQTTGILARTFSTYEKAKRALIAHRALHLEADIEEELQMAAQSKAAA